MHAISPEITNSKISGLSLVDDFTSKYINSGGMAGAISLVAQADKVLHFNCSGKMNLESGQDMRSDAIFRIYSMTKPITAVAAMILYERGCFQLDTPISDFIPEFKDMQVYVGGDVENYQTERAENQITFRHLLTHTSGLAYGIFHDSVVDQLYQMNSITPDQNGETVKDLVLRVAKLPLQFQPGKYWCYSCSSDVLGYLIEVISGKTLDQFFEDEIFNPLGMTDTSFYVPEAKQYRFTTNYIHRSALPEDHVADAQDKILFPFDDPKNGIFSSKPSKLMGGGGLVSTLSDYYSFTKMLMDKGRVGSKQLLSAATIDLMTKNHLNGDMKEICMPGLVGFDYPDVGFGLGFAVKLKKSALDGFTSAGEYFWGGAAHTTFFIDPAKNMIGLLLTQVFPPKLYQTDIEFKVAIYKELGV